MSDLPEGWHIRLLLSANRRMGKQAAPKRQVISWAALDGKASGLLQYGHGEPWHRITPVRFKV